MAAVTITTLDPAVARTLEPRAAASARRLRTIRTLTDAGDICRGQRRADNPLRYRT